MGHFSLYDQITEHGTLSEPKGVSNPHFALLGTIHWMRGLALLVDDKGLDFGSAWKLYSSIRKREFTVHEENSVFEQLILALHQLSAEPGLIRRLQRVGPPLTAIPASRPLENALLPGPEHVRQAVLRIMV